MAPDLHVRRFEALRVLRVSSFVPGREIGHPMALVILGGLIASTLLALFAMRALYVRFGSSPQPGSPHPAPAHA